MNAYCAECGRRVPKRLNSDGSFAGFCRCPRHPDAKRLPEKYVAALWTELRFAVGLPARTSPAASKYRTNDSGAFVALERRAA